MAIAKAAAKCIKIKFSPEAYEELEKLREEMKKASVEDVIRDALTYLRWSREQKIDGTTLCTVERKSPIKIEPIRLSFLD